ncbi:MAG: hypothetical protein QOG62_2347 [Thermoleophilaceae bacterium]|jgi:AcrR family transcriptional regulator|nr:hypothetical protein [Thermoleophilaceae bacterium]
MPARDKTPGRPRQTQRTRRALVAAADELFAEGLAPTVTLAAERADVSRATAYRYFPTQEALLLATEYLGDSEALRILPELAHEIDDPAERIAEAVRRGAVWTLGRESRLRAILRVSLDPASGAARPARRREYIRQLTASFAGELAPEAYEGLVGSLTLLFGIDPIVAIRDNSSVPASQIPDLLAWTARAVVSSALAQAEG